MLPCAFFSEMAMFRMQSTGSAGFTLSITSSASSFLRCVASLSW